MQITLHDETSCTKLFSDGVATSGPTLVKLVCALVKLLRINTILAMVYKMAQYLWLYASLEYKCLGIDTAIRVCITMY